MAAGNKKRKKPAANPARGFAKTSVQSKSKVEPINQETSTDASGAASISTPAEDEPPALPAQSLERNEDIQERLEEFELQQFVETHASKVKREASRQVSRLQTERRVLRGQSDFLPMTTWLPEELMQQVLDLNLSDLDKEDRSIKQQDLPLGDDLVSKIWNLRLVLYDLDVPLTKIEQVIAYLLQHPPDEHTSPVWALPDALGWLALNCTSDELLEYDEQKKQAVVEPEDSSNSIAVDPIEDYSESVHRKHDPPLSDTEKPSDISHTSDDAQVSDIESDLEPDELVSRTNVWSQLGVSQCTRGSLSTFTLSTRAPSLPT